jgi:hypothetical protein
MEVYGCTCSNTPTHDHIGAFKVIDGVGQCEYTDEIQKIWVDWKAVARALIMENCTRNKVMKT